jgi:hypothetical protein
MKKKILFTLLALFALTGTSLAEEYPEEIQQQLEEKFKNEFPGNTITINSYHPTNENEFFNLLSINAEQAGISKFFYHNRG